MDSKNVYEVKINKNTYDVISADTAFYAFMGDRLYEQIITLVAPEDAKRLPEYIRAGKSQIVSLREKDGSLIKCIAAFKNLDDSLVDIRFLLVDNIADWEQQVRGQINKKNDILGLYGDYYFEYDVPTRQVRIYAAERFEQNMSTLTLEEFSEHLMERANEKNEEDVKNLIAALQNGKERFAINIAGDILDLKETAYTLFKGVSHYEDGKYTYATGYVHFWNERSTDSVETKRALERDYLTGVLTKAEITNFAINTVDVKKVNNVTLAIIDIDYFKKVNDVYGHMMGDEVLKRVAATIRNEVRDEGIVGRFGGDEFLVLFYNAYDMENMRERLRSIKNSVASCFVKTENGEDISITLSIGCAAYPKDADNYEDLFFLADSALYRAKEKGRNRYIIYNKEKHGTIDDLKNNKMSVNTLNSRGNMSVAELVCAMQDTVYTGQDYPLDKLLDDIALNLNIQRVMLYAGHPRRLVGMAGANRLSREVVDTTKEYVDAPALAKLYEAVQIVAIDNIRRFETTSPTLYEQLQKQGIMSFLHVKFKDKNGVDAVLSLEYIKSTMSWNRTHFPYYRLLAKALSEYDLGR
ncbi:MAG: GGDEF domain-containing protein [Lachnospiraceae bacterium]|nr:GGDEF domain-containing protein [Lachnospiraceae bacterium]